MILLTTVLISRRVKHFGSVKIPLTDDCCPLFNTIFPSHIHVFLLQVSLYVTDGFSAQNSGRNKRCQKQNAVQNILNFKGIIASHNLNKN